MVKTTKYSERDHITISIPRGLLAEVKKIINDTKLGYDTPTEFCKEAIRKHIALIKRNKLDKKLIEKSRDYLETIEKAKH